MEYILQNNYLKAVILEKGAELSSLKNVDNIEYIWQGDPCFWPRHAPVLFPLVGKVLDNTYTHNDTFYNLSQHGFARNMKFKLFAKSKDSLSFVLVSDTNTKLSYPFDFEFYITYILTDKMLKVQYKLINKGNTEMGFKIGAHPGFNCPVFEDERSDYFLSFDKHEDAKLLKLTPEGYFTHESENFKGQKIDISPSAFVNDALVFADLKSKEVSLCSKSKGKILTLNFEGFPFLGIWSLPVEAPFVCIEPWFGHGDFVDDENEFMNKKDIVKLEPNSTFKCSHSITVNKQS